MARWDEAQQHFEDALDLNGRMQARPSVAHTQHDYAAMLVKRAGPGDHRRASELNDAALETATELGMHALVDKGAAFAKRIAAAD